MYTPLHVAAEHGHTEVVEMLVKLGAGDVNSVRVRGYDLFIICVSLFEFYCILLFVSFICISYFIRIYSLFT